MKQTNTLTKGCILISKPLINDGFFEQSVVYLTAHDNEGSLGFTLNKKSNLIAQDFIDGLPGEDPIFFGGPVEQDALFFMHAFEDLAGAVPVGNNLFLGGDFEEFKARCNAQDPDGSNIQRPKFFLGYSGWSEGQLEAEYEDDTWIVSLPPTEISILNTSTDAWKKHMLRLGGKYALWANAPSDPLLN